jgi:hypothetical protein
MTFTGYQGVKKLNSDIDALLKKRTFNINKNANQHLIHSIEFSCEVKDFDKECVSKAQYHEVTTEMATGKSSDLYLCSDHFYLFKEFWTEAKGGITINRPKIKARKNIEFKRELKKDKPFDPRLFK